MRRPILRIHCGFSTITLLGTSTILVAAAGETLWHASAAAGERRAAPTTGVAPAVMVATSASAAKGTFAMFTGEPVFKPFVMVRLPVPEGCTGGLVRDVNENGLAVGWVDDTGSGERYPFVFDNTTNTMHLLSLPSGCTWGEALALNDGTSTLRVVGYVRVEYQSALYDRPSQWDVDLSDWSDTRSYGSATDYDGSMTAVNDSGSVGAYEYDVTPGNTPSVWRRVGNTIYSSLWVVPQISGRMNSDHAMVGRWWPDGEEENGHAFLWVHGENVATIDPGDWDYSAAYDINDNFDIVGWVAETESDKVPALWEHEGEGWLTLNPFPAESSALAVAVNSEREIIVVHDDSQPGAALWSRVGSNNVGRDLTGMVLFPGTNDEETEYVLQTATSINDNLWIGGSYVEHQTVSPFGYGEPQPCLVIPYDVDNNGEPDYREILEGKREGYTDLDTNSNWLLDWAENISGAGMRTGLHSPPYGNSPPHQIDEAQIVRLMVFLQGPQQGPGLDGEEEFSIQDALDGPNGFCEGIKRWSRDNVDREIVVWLRSTLNRTGYGWNQDNDVLPEDATQRAQILSDLHAFSHHYAHCIDYIQLGNEVFGGAGQYMFTDDELSNCGTWSDFEEWGDLSNSCKAAASPLVLDWLDDLMWAALEGSALAGRPYRIVSPGMLGSHVRSGYGNSSTVAFQVIDGVSEWANDRQMFFDVHMHYESYSQFLETAQKISDNFAGSPGWEVPERLVVLEWGPTASDAWVSANNGDYGKFREESGCEDPPSYEDWEEFVAAWKAELGGPWEGDFYITTSLDDLADYGFHFVCYGPTGQNQNANLKYDMKCLWANRTCDEYITAEDHLTPMTTEFIDAAEDHQITFGTRIACPTCPGN